MSLTKRRAGGNIGLSRLVDRQLHRVLADHIAEAPIAVDDGGRRGLLDDVDRRAGDDVPLPDPVDIDRDLDDPMRIVTGEVGADRSEEHTSELQSLMRISYAVFCLKNKKKKISTEQYFVELVAVVIQM